MCLARGGVGGEGSELRELGLGFNKSRDRGSVGQCLCFGCGGVGGVGGEWVKGAWTRVDERWGGVMSV